MFVGDNYPVKFKDIWEDETKRCVLLVEDDVRIPVALDCLDPTGAVVVVDRQQRWYAIEPADWSKLTPYDTEGVVWLELSLTFARAELKRAEAFEGSDDWEDI